MLARHEDHPDLPLDRAACGVDAGYERSGCTCVVCRAVGIGCALRDSFDAFADLIERVPETVLQRVVHLALDDAFDRALDRLLDRDLDLLGDRAGNSRLDLLLNGFEDAGLDLLRNGVRNSVLDLLLDGTLDLLLDGLGDLVLELLLDLLIDRVVQRFIESGIEQLRAGVVAEGRRDDNRQWQATTHKPCAAPMADAVAVIDHGPFCGFVTPFHVITVDECLIFRCPWNKSRAQPLMEHSKQDSRDLRAELLTILPRVRRFARSLTGNRHDGDDLMQSTVERVLAKGLPPDVELLRWMFKVCRNLWIDDRRAQQVRRRAHREPELSEEPIVSGEAVALGQLKLREVERALARLSEEQRDVLALVAVEGLSYREAAEVLETPIGTVMSRLARARAALAADLEPSAVERAE